MLEPLVISQNHLLISGHRRLQALQNLGWQEVNCQIIQVDESEATSLIIHFNKQRIKTCRELLNEGKTLFPLMKVGQGKRSDLTSDLQTRSGRTRDIVGEAVGVSGSHLEKLLYIEKNQPHLIAYIDNGEVSVLQAYRQARQLNAPKSGRQLPANTNKHQNNKLEVMTGDCEILLQQLDVNSFHACITDPPYGIEMAQWDFSVPTVDIWKQVYRVLKPGAFLLSFASPRLYHRMAVAIEDAGFLIKDQIMWMTTTRMPKRNQLKGAHEPIVVAQKPLDGTLEQNHLKWGCGLIDIEDARVAWDGDIPPDYALGGFQRTVYGKATIKGSTKQLGKISANKNGRYPSNIIGEVHPNEQKYFY